MNKNDFYVYEWFNTQNGDIFYIGKGRKDRYKTIAGRNSYFLEYMNSNPVDVRIIKNNLTELEALDYEREKWLEYKDIYPLCNLMEAGYGGLS